MHQSARSGAEHLPKRSVHLDFQFWLKKELHRELPNARLTLIFDNAGTRVSGAAKSRWAAGQG